MHENTESIVGWFSWLPLALRPENGAQVVVLLIGLVFAIAVALYTWRQWQVDLRRLLWAGRLTRTMALQGLAIHHEARQAAAARGDADPQAVDSLADAAWKDRPLLDREIEARMALWLLSQPWHDGPARERRYRAGWVFVSRSEALRIVQSRRRLGQLFEEVRHEAGDLPRTREVLLQLVPEVNRGIRGRLPT